MFIKLTAIAEDNRHGEIFFNMNQALYFTESKTKDYTVIMFREVWPTLNEPAPSKFIKVKETPERIMALIASAK